ncbi:MAG: CsgG/HfaB family protein [Arcobacter sp.]|uniref:CsgG/HfaB family protein n=1 Tax=Arcobacter sp. TaxID=1872629 RepID=UPI003B005AD1
MLKYTKIATSIVTLSILTGCSTVTPNIVNISKPTAVQPNIIVKKEEPVLKRKVAIARFGNEAQYGKSALFGLNNTYNAEKQATDILSAKLANSGKFVLLERDDLSKINNELKTQNLSSLNIGANYLIVGSVSEFGRKNISDTGVFSRTKIQSAYAKVSVRLIDVKTGQIIFAQEGAGEAKSEAGTAFGVGKHVGYDSTLNDKAISTAIASVVDGIMQNLLNKPWRSYILSIEDSSIIIAGGEKQGLKIGDTFNIYKQGKSIKNPQTGIIIELPGKKIATISIISQFGTSYTDEGSICQIIEGNIKGVNKDELYIQK